MNYLFIIYLLFFIEIKQPAGREVVKFHELVRVGAPAGRRPLAIKAGFLSMGERCNIPGIVVLVIHIYTKKWGN